MVGIQIPTYACNSDPYCIQIVTEIALKITSLASSSEKPNPSVNVILLRSTCKIK